MESWFRLHVWFTEAGELKHVGAINPFPPRSIEALAEGASGLARHELPTARVKFLGHHTVVLTSEMFGGAPTGAQLDESGVI